MSEIIIEFTKEKKLQIIRDVRAKIFAYKSDKELLALYNALTPNAAKILELKQYIQYLKDLPTQVTNENFKEIKILKFREWKTENG